MLDDLLVRGRSPGGDAVFCDRAGAAARHAAGTRRGGVRLRRTVDVARDPALQDCQQHEVARDLRGLCCHDGGFRGDNFRHPDRIDPGQRRDGDSRFSSGEISLRLGGGCGCGNHIQFSFVPSGSSGLVCTRYSFCGAGGTGGDSAVTVCDRHGADWALFRKRSLLRVGVLDEAAWNSVLRFCGIVLAVAGVEAAVSLAQCCGARRGAVGRAGVAVWADVPDTFPRRSLFQLLVLDLVLCA